MRLSLMKYLVDTHILLWSFIEPEKLSDNIRKLLLDEDNDIYYSPINLWEISIKYGLKKLKLNGLTPEEFYNELEDSYYLCKEVNNKDLITNYKLPMYHKDPFDRFLIWEAMKNDFIFMSIDDKMELYKKDGLKVIY
jgi:PIN domain nuclease of toxin-antitoxin system